MKLIENLILQVELDYDDAGVFKTARIKKVFSSSRTKPKVDSKRELMGANIEQVEM